MVMVTPWQPHRPSDSNEVGHNKQNLGWLPQMRKVLKGPRPVHAKEDPVFYIQGHTSCAVLGRDQERHCLVFYNALPK